MDLTMLRQMSRRTHIDSLLHEGDKLSKKLAEILEPGDPSAVMTSLDPAEEAAFLAKAIKFSMEDYSALLQYLHSTGKQYRNFQNIPHPPNALVLPPYATHPLQFHWGNNTFSTQNSHEGNSAIQFYNPLTQNQDTGFIHTIWTLPLESVLHTFIVVHCHRELSAVEEGQAPFKHYTGFMARIFDALPSQNFVIIEPTHIITHLTTFRRPAGTYGIQKETVVVSWALNRGRR